MNLRELISQSDLAEDLQRYITTNKTPTNPAVRKAIVEFGGIQAFALAFHKWIQLQTQPFLNLRNPLATNASTAHAMSYPIRALPNNQDDALSLKNSDLRSLQLDPETSKSEKKPKKRMTPNVVTSFPARSGESSLTTHGNISSLPNSFEFEGARPNLSSSRTPLSQEKLIMDESITIFTVGNSVESTSLSSSSSTSTSLPLPSPLQESQHSTLPWKSAIPNATNGTIPVTSAPTSVSALLTLRRETSIDFQTSPTAFPANSFISSSPTNIMSSNPTNIMSSSPISLTRSMSSSGIASSVSFDFIDLDSTLDNSVLGDNNESHAIERLALLYSSLVTYGMLSVSLAIPLLAKLAAIRSSGCQIVLRVKDPSQFSTVIFTDSQLRHFVALSVEGLFIIIRALGTSIALGFSESDAVKECIPDVSLSLKTASEDYLEQEFMDDSALVSRDNFIRPFRDDVDSRLEYKNQLEMKLFNERESCFDQFSDLFRRFQTVSRSDIDGKKTSEFWVEVQRTGSDLIRLREINVSWFADLFVSMLLFYGSNSRVASLSAVVEQSAAEVIASTTNTNNSRNAVARNGMIYYRNNSNSNSERDSSSNDNSSSYVAKFATSNQTQFQKAGVTYAANAAQTTKGSGWHSGGSVGAGAGRGGGYKHDSSRFQAIDKKSSSSTVSAPHAALPVKSREQQVRLEERLGLGGEGDSQQSQGFHKSAFKAATSGGSSAGKKMHSKRQLPLDYLGVTEEPAQYFPGNQQFFYRFLVLTDNHRYSVNI